jgi:glycosidase
LTSYTSYKQSARTSNEPVTARQPLLERLIQSLQIIYSKEEAALIFADLKNLMDLYRRDDVIVQKRSKREKQPLLSEKDAFLITYADTIYKDGENPLRTLHRFLQTYVKDAVSGVHILSFFPSSSDNGYAVIDYKKVDPRFGTWADIRRIAKDYRLIVDLVLNHVSSQSEWFKGFLEGEKRYQDYFIWSTKRVDMPEVFRPRETPLFTEFPTAMGKRYLWTTFSADQIDLNYKNPEVLLRIIDVFLFYLSQGAEVIRLDAIGYIWKEPHTSCVNLSKTHQLVKLLRSILEYVAPYALILTEANFPYKDNVAYFGEGHEAHMVYNFSLPPLVIDAFARRNTRYIREVTERTRQDLLFFDFLASHDGIGLPGIKNILSKEDLDNLLYITKAHGGFVSYQATDGGEDPYELNINYFDAINDPDQPHDPLAVKRFMASQAIMLALKGIPGMYIHSLLGSRNYYEGVKKTGIKRTINRERLLEERLETSLSNTRSLRHQVLASFLSVLKVRETVHAFHPSSTRKLIDCDKRLLAIERRFEDNTVLAVINVSEDMVGLPEYKGRLDAITGRPFQGNAEPYACYFLR